ncbi:MAG: hypothetical protein ACOX81_00340 [Candidatus Heteroscillospira sp.]|jgi:hypothetical protein
MDRELVAAMTPQEREKLLYLKRVLGGLIDEMIDSFGFEEKEGVDHRAHIFDAVTLMEEGVATLRPELMSDFNAIFDQITMVYFEPEKFFSFTDSYRDAQGVLQLDSANMGEFYGRSMAALSRVKEDFESRLGDLT